MFPITSNTEQQVRVAFAPKTESGNDATIDGAIRFEVTEGDATVSAGTNDLEIVVKPGAANVLSRIRVYADADLDAGEERLIEEELVYTVTAVEAASLAPSVVVEPLQP